MSTIRITPGFSESERAQIAALYWQAFGAKLAIGLGPDRKALPFLARVANPDYALCARDSDNTLLGVAGFKTNQGALIGGSFQDLSAIYGWFGAAWRAALLSLLDRGLEPGVLLMDGIFVNKPARGRGVGTLLLDALKEKAQHMGCKEVRLDVIDTNPRAMRLYKREGFQPCETQQLGPLRHFFGFTSATEMRFALQPHS